MAELRDVLGSILRDVSTSRVASDLFTRDVSVVYRDDPQLRGFPVPRLEIREATIDLKFAVLEIEEGEAGRPTISGDSLRAYLTNLVGPLLKRSVFVGDLEKTLLERGLRPETLAAPIAGRVAEAVEARPQLLEQILNHESTALTATVEESLRTSGDLWSVVESMGRIRAVRKSLSEELPPRMADLAASLRAEAQAPRAELKVKVAITSNELTDIPPEKVSHVRIVTGIQNYFWSGASEAGEGVPRLLAE